jgi:NDP-sugar pyrophosphorylase family protein
LVVDDVSASGAGLAGPAALAGLDLVVLAGGLGTRLRPVVADRPKALAPVGDRPFLDLLLAWFRGQGVRSVVLALGHMAGQVEARLPELRRRLPGLELRASVEAEPLGTGGALRACLPHLSSDPVLVANGDSFVEADLGAFLTAFAASGAAAGLVAVEVPDAARFGRLELSAAGDRVLRFAEKDPAFAGPARINGGLYLFRRGPLEERLPPAGVAASLERDVLERLAGPAGRLMAFPADGRFVDIGTPASLAAASDVLAPYLHPDPPAP